MASTHNRETNPVLPVILKLLSPIHQGLLYNCTTPDRTNQKGQTMGVDDSMPTRIPGTEEPVHEGTHTQNPKST